MVMLEVTSNCCNLKKWASTLQTVLAFSIRCLDLKFIVKVILILVHGL